MHTGGVFLMRVKLTDRPGALGRVATALGTAKADISAVEVVDRGEGWAVDDFMFALPPDVKADSLVTSCSALPGVEVLWMSRYPEAWSLESDIDVLTRMLDDPENAEHTLVMAAPSVFHVSWGLVIDRDSGAVVWHTELAPELDATQTAVLGDLETARTLELPHDWAAGWGEVVLAVAPFRGRSSIVVGRDGGPEFRRSELARLRHLAALSDLH